jgi:environmental stress-induced protein Ves
MRVVRRTEQRVVPWKNGLGATTEIAAFPAGATVDDFGWRVSSATVAEDGPFSLFPGVSRTLVLLEGDGLILDGPQPATLDTRYARHRFQGDHPVHARLIGGPVTDLNVMTRSETWQHTVVIGGGWLSASLLVALEPSVVRSAGGTVTLAAGDAAFPEADAEVRGVVAAITFTAL